MCCVCVVCVLYVCTGHLFFTTPCKNVLGFDGLYIFLGKYVCVARFSEILCLLVQIFPDVMEPQAELSESGFLRSTLSVPHASMSHAGTYHCNIEDGTERESNAERRTPGLCCKLPCLPFITASHPATISVIGH